MRKEKPPVRENKIVTSSPRVVPEHERVLIDQAPYSGERVERVIDRGEWLPHPPKKS